MNDTETAELLGKDNPSIEEVDKHIIEVSQQTAELSRKKEAAERKLKSLLRIRSNLESKKEEVSKMRKIYMTLNTLKGGIVITELFHGAELAYSNSEARMIIKQGVAFINGKKYNAIDTVINETFLVNNELMLCVNDEKYCKIIVNDNQYKTIQRKEKQIRIAELQGR